ncbi:hypothetical protein PR048_020983 [Dryococelus australis]|uniref:Uncharacterized protein n=1 Tax=Dryococelus australis TaxID=614101 RepID=A0ABQ9GWY2_9NEOP|nr:hypothetical protein PR048_020983 [Dryococelus australis]
MVNLLEMGDRLQNSVNGYAAHVGRKENLQFDDDVIHVDFSENYNCSFADETQAFHFGGSRKQVSLHTVVTYLHDKNSQLDMLYTIHSFCTISDCFDHSVHAMWAHLKPIVKTLPNAVNTIHFWSDNPSTQYQNIKKCSRCYHYILETCSQMYNTLRGTIMKLDMVEEPLMVLGVRVNELPTT